MLDVREETSEHLDAVRTFIAFTQMLQTSQPEVVRYTSICLAFIKKLKKKADYDF